MKFVVIVNQPGYLPDGEPVTFTDANSAADYMAQEMGQTAVHDEEDGEVPEEAWKQLQLFREMPQAGFAFSFKGYEHDIAVE